MIYDSDAKKTTNRCPPASPELVTRLPLPRPPRKRERFGQGGTSGQVAGRPPGRYIMS